MSFTQGHSSDLTTRKIHSGKITKQKCYFMLEDSKDLIFQKIRNLKISILDNFSVSSELLLWHCSRLCLQSLPRTLNTSKVSFCTFTCKHLLLIQFYISSPSLMSQVSNNNFTKAWFVPLPNYVQSLSLQNLYR